MATKTKTKKQSGTDLVREGFAALSAHDLDGMAKLWNAETVEEVVPVGTFTGEANIRGYFEGVLASFPDFGIEIERTLEQDEFTVVQWAASGTFTGAKFQGVSPNGAKVAFRGCDLFEIADEVVVRNTIYFDSAVMARQIGLLPPAGSGAESKVLAVVNGLASLRTPQRPVQRSAPGSAPAPPEGKVSVQDLFGNYIQGHKAKDVARIAAHWHPDGRAQVEGGETLEGPDGMATFFGEIFHAFPDFELEVERTVAEGPFISMQWRASGTFTGGRFQGLAPNGRSVEMRGIDVFEAEGNRWRSATVYMDSTGLMRQLGVLPPQESGPDRAMTAAFNGFTKLKGTLGR